MVTAKNQTTAVGQQSHKAVANGNPTNSRGSSIEPFALSSGTLHPTHPLTYSARKAIAYLWRTFTALSSTFAWLFDLAIKIDTTCFIQGTLTINLTIDVTTVEDTLQNKLGDRRALSSSVRRITSNRYRHRIEKYGNISHKLNHKTVCILIALRGPMTSDFDLLTHNSLVGTPVTRNVFAKINFPRLRYKSYQSWVICSFTFSRWCMNVSFERTDCFDEPRGIKLIVIALR